MPKHLDMDRHPVNLLTVAVPYYVRRYIESIAERDGETVSYETREALKYAVKQAKAGKWEFPKTKK